MIVPQHWAEAIRRERIDGRQVTVRRFGWSDRDRDEAQTLAESRATEALERLRRGEVTPRREPRVPYNGAEGVPIREEIVRRVGEVVITRNSYGALCLNVADVLFADVDFERPGSPVAGCVLGLVLAPLCSWWGLGVAGRQGAVVGFVLGAVVGFAIPKLLRHLAVRLRGGAERVAIRRVERLVRRHPDWRLELYRTPAGLRVLCTHGTFDPTGAETEEVFRTLDADPLYRRMCVRQRCFRARLSAKPWRIGIPGHLRPRPGVWPVDAGRLEQRRAWLADYDRRAAAFAACRHLRTLGEGAEHPRAAQVRALHDPLSRAHEALPIA
jgi:hypothetical protein